ncbi:MAG: diguanylate cyclase [Rhodobacterales bacterium]|nr:diguanylate cyclase [Rhodobacterales bacterium]
MGWFDFSKNSGDSAKKEDDVTLKALVFLLTSWIETVPKKRRPRVQKLLDRIQRPPLPTGLLRELESVWKDLRPRETRNREQARALADLARNMVGAMRITSLFDTELQNRIDKLSDAIPPEVGVGDVRKINREVITLRRAAIPARERTREEREQMSGLVRDLSIELNNSVNTSATINAGVSDLVKALDGEVAPDAMQQVRSSLLSKVRVLANDVSDLRKELKRAHGRSDSLAGLVAEQAKLLVDVRALAALDSLTQLCHRGTFEKAIEERMLHANRTGTPCGLLLLDIDYFKKVNDTHGHPMGDKVLVAVAACVTAQVRDGDLVARVGGEEFAVILPGARRNVVDSVAERIREAVSGLTFDLTNGKQFAITVSLGATLRREDDTSKAMYGRCDKALYQAKTSGRNRSIHEE